MPYEKKSAKRKNIDAGILDKIIKKTLSSIEKGEKQIFEIAENARDEYNRVKQELEEVKVEVKGVIERVDQLEVQEKKARLYLMKVSGNFHKFSGSEIQEAYLAARDLQVSLTLAREKESSLRNKRNELEFSLKRLGETVEKAENLITQVGVVLKYLTSNLSDLSIQLEEIHQRQVFALKIIKAQEEERKRVAREIHDGPVQALAKILISANLCDKYLELNSPKLPKEIGTLKENAGEILQELRKIIFDLRPMALDDLGLLPTVKHYIKEFEKKNLITVELKLLGKEKKLSSSLSLVLFRIIQEGLTNIQKHADADFAQVTLEFAPNSTRVTIKDEGRGFRLDEVLLDPHKECYGLIGLQERVELLDGDIQILTSPGRGSTIKANIPIR